MKKKTIAKEFGHVLIVEDVEIALDEEGEEIDTPYTRIDSLYVLPMHRGQGHARELLQEAMKGLKGTIKIVAQPQEKEVDMTRLIKFYESVGFVLEERNILSMEI